MITLFLANTIKWLIISLAIVVGLSFLGRYHWTLEIFSHFVVWYVLSAGILAIAALCLEIRPWAAAAAVILLLELVHWQLVLPSWARAPTHKTGDTLTILQFNALKYNTKTNIESITDGILNLPKKPDILVLLETTDAWDDSLQRLRKHYPHSLEQRARNVFDFVIMTTLEAPEMELRMFDNDPRFRILRLQAKTPESHTPFVLYAMHPPPPMGAGMAEWRNWQLLTAAEQIRQEPYAHKILLGDLNITPWSYWFGQLLQKSGLRNGQTDVGGLSNSWSLFGTGLFLIPIDHTLVSPAVRVLERTAGKEQGSDHKPVTTVLRLTAN